MYEYGLMNDELNITEYDDGSSMYWFDDNPQGGIPKTFKTGAYFTDMPTSSTKVSLNYSYKKKQKDTESSTANQYFFPDTAYRTTEKKVNHSETARAFCQSAVNQKLDSLNDLDITSKLTYTLPEQGNVQENAFFADDDTLTRTTYTRK
jgi:hypothetical protein